MAKDEDSDSDWSDSDSVEEIQIKRFLNKDFGESIKQAKYQQDSHKGVKPQKSHYYLLKCQKNPSQYDGKHWDVAADNHFERSTRRLTKRRIDTAVDKEQSMQMNEGKHRWLQARKSLTPMTNEFKEVMCISEKMQIVNNACQQSKSAKVKDEVQGQLVRKSNIERVSKETEQERHDQIRILRSMAPNANRSASTEDLVKSMAETNKRRSVINRDLEEACLRLMDSEEVMDNSYQSAMMEMLDESLIKVVFMFDRNKTKALFEEEKIQRIRDFNNLFRDKLRGKAIKNYDSVLTDVKQLARLIKLEEEAKEHSQQSLVKELKTEVQEELMRKVSRKWAEQVMAAERSRRIQEMEMSMKRTNQAKEDTKQMMSRIQRQMIIEKFGGKWIVAHKNLNKKKQGTEENTAETAQDRKLRSMRMNFRRPSGVIRCDDD